MATEVKKTWTVPMVAEASLRGALGVPSGRGVVIFPDDLWAYLVSQGWHADVEVEIRIIADSILVVPQFRQSEK